MNTVSPATRAPLSSFFTLMQCCGVGKFSNYFTARIPCQPGKFQGPPAPSHSPLRQRIFPAHRQVVSAPPQRLGPHERFSDQNGLWRISGYFPIG